MSARLRRGLRNRWRRALDSAGVGAVLAFPVACALLAVALHLWGVTP